MNTTNIKPATVTKRQLRHKKLVERAVLACGGRHRNLAERMPDNIRTGHVQKWLSCERPVTPEIAHEIEIACQGRVKREDFYPDLFLDFERSVPAGSPPNKRRRRNALKDRDEAFPVPQ